MCIAHIQLDNYLSFKWYDLDNTANIKTDGIYAVVIMKLNYVYLMELLLNALVTWFSELYCDPTEKEMKSW